MQRKQDLVADLEDVIRTVDDPNDRYNRKTTERASDFIFRGPQLESIQDTNIENYYVETKSLKFKFREERHILKP